MTPIRCVYSIFGLRIRSEVPLGEYFPQLPQDVPPDVEIREDRIDAAEVERAGYSQVEGGTLLTVPRVGRFLIRDGREITVDPAPESSPRNLRVFLLGSAFGALLHQRGLLPLHANAVEVDGNAVAFCGHSGAGKSTIAAWFMDRGHRVLADDVCVIAFDPGGQALAYPGIPRLRLWREALEASGRTAVGYERSFEGADKYDVPTAQERPDEPLPLSRIYLLGKATEDEPKGRILRLGGVEAIDALVSNTYRGGYLSMIGRTGEHLMACVRIARAVPIFRAHRTWGFDDFDPQARLLAEHARSADS